MCSARGAGTISDILPSKPSDNWLIVNLNDRNYETTEVLTYYLLSIEFD